MIAPNNNYCLFEDWLMPVLDQMLVEQQREVRKSIFLIVCSSDLYIKSFSIDSVPQHFEEFQDLYFCCLLRVYFLTQLRESVE